MTHPQVRSLALSEILDLLILCCKSHFGAERLSSLKNKGLSQFVSRLQGTYN